jgi:hypothetical protein
MEQKKENNDAEVLSLALCCMRNPKLFQFFVEKGCFGEDTEKAMEAFNEEYKVYEKNPDAIARYTEALEQAKAEAPKAKEKTVKCKRCKIPGGNLREVADDQTYECFIICRECWVEAIDNEEQLSNVSDNWTDDEEADDEEQ